MGSVADSRHATRTLDDYSLYSRIVPESGGRSRTVYFFSRMTPMGGTPATVPDGFEVVMLSTGPAIRRKKRW